MKSIFDQPALPPWILTPTIAKLDAGYHRYYESKYARDQKRRTETIRRNKRRRRK